MAKGEISFEQWFYELQALRKTYTDSTIKEAIKRSLTGAADGTICNIGADTSLDSIIKKLTIIYEIAKTVNLPMRFLKTRPERGRIS